MFFGQHHPFSNFHPSTIEIDGVKYSHSEQYIQAEKAKLFNDDATHNNIMKASSPGAMKYLGHNVQGFKADVWHSEIPKISYATLLAKFSQHTHLKDILLQTGRRTLAEASTDALWASGVKLGHPNCLDQSSWTGENHMGKTMERIRTELS